MITLFCIRPKGFNVGNDAIFMGLQYFVYQAFGEVVNLISLPATARYESQSKAGLTGKTIYEINQYGHGVIVGGGNLYENGELDVNVEALQTMEVPLMLFSLSRGRVYNRRYELTPRTDSMSERVVRALNEKAAFSLARDQATADYLHATGCPRAVTGGCPTLFLDRTAERLPKLSERDRADVLISVRNPSLMSIPLPKQTRVFDDVNRIIALLRRRGHRDIRLLCHDHRDIPFAASFHDVDYVYTGDVYTYLAMLRGCSLNVSYRLHSVLPCLAYGTPVIPISYDERAISPLETFGYGDWNINLVSSPDVAADVENRLERLAELPGRRQATQPTWDRYYGVMASAFGSFADHVRAYRDQAQVRAE